MYRSATITVYDAFESVYITAVVRSWEDHPPRATSQVTEVHEQIDSVGRETDSMWLRDALVALAERC